MIVSKLPEQASNILSTMASTVLLLIVLHSLSVAAAQGQASLALPGCPDRCGNITVPYPFGIGPKCYRVDGLGSRGFELECDDTGTSPPRLTFFGNKNYPLANVSLATSQLMVYAKATPTCFHFTNGLDGGDTGAYTSVDTRVYRLSGNGDIDVPLMLDWAVRDVGSCNAAQDARGFACRSAHSECFDVTKDANGEGYGCKCFKGYDGNPYLEHGCTDIDECAHPDKYPCKSGGDCKNKEGGYDCPCKRGMKGDGKTECTETFPLPAKVGAGVGGVSITIVLVFSVVYLGARKRMKEFFIKNGGPILEKFNSIKIFKEEELKRITKNYSDTLGSGAFGVVYKGFLDDKQPVAVKKSKHTSKAQKEQFANEVIIQSRVIHKNIVRLIGCCLEVDVPILVYEFVPNGNLDEILHDKCKVPLTMDQRIAIAEELAEGLAYMHSKTSTNIQHGDVKPANILLDDNFIPKISDFGISRLIARGNDEHSEEVIGDNNYMDPVYRETGWLTNKSDVYSFGLVLYELITGNKANCGGGDCRFVINHLESYIQLKQDKNPQLFPSLAEIARECLSGVVELRPEMTDVAERLQIIRKWYTHKSPY